MYSSQCGYLQHSLYSSEVWTRSFHQFPRKGELWFLPCHVDNILHCVSKLIIHLLNGQGAGYPSGLAENFASYSSYIFKCK